MEFKEIQDLLKAVNRYGLTEVEIERKDFKIKIRNKKEGESNVIYAAPAAVPSAQAAAPAPPSTPAPAPVEAQPASGPAPKAEPAPAAESGVQFKAPMIGTFYRSPSPDEPPFVEVGTVVKKGQTLCVIEAMKLFNEIESEIDGKIVKVLAEDAQPVEYDQPLFLIEPA